MSLLVLFRVVLTFECNSSVLCFVALTVSLLSLTVLLRQKEGNNFTIEADFSPFLLGEIISYFLPLTANSVKEGVLCQIFLSAVLASKQQNPCDSAPEHRDGQHTC